MSFDSLHLCVLVGSVVVYEVIAFLLVRTVMKCNIIKDSIRNLYLLSYYKCESVCVSIFVSQSCLAQQISMKFGTQIPVTDEVACKSQ